MLFWLIAYRLLNDVEGAYLGILRLFALPSVGRLVSWVAGALWHRNLKPCRVQPSPSRGIMLKLTHYPNKTFIDNTIALVYIFQSKCFPNKSGQALSDSVSANKRCSGELRGGVHVHEEIRHNTKFDGSVYPAQHDS